ncbi:MAG: hypothetical protein HYV02_00580 [Deltaproteobacteria bacterium]|nr:hypothetical protein [Deltaproteobacteria bacterium]
MRSFRPTWVGPFCVLLLLGCSGPGYHEPPPTGPMEIPSALDIMLPGTTTPTVVVPPGQEPLPPIPPPPETPLPIPEATVTLMAGTADALTIVGYDPGKAVALTADGTWPIIAIAPPTVPPQIICSAQQAENIACVLDAHGPSGQYQIKAHYAYGTVPADGTTETITITAGTGILTLTIPWGVTATDAPQPPPPEDLKKPLFGGWNFGITAQNGVATATFSIVKSVSSPDGVVFATASEAWNVEPPQVKITFVDPMILPTVKNCSPHAPNVVIVPTFVVPLTPDPVIDHYTLNITYAYSELTPPPQADDLETCDLVATGKGGLTSTLKLKMKWYIEPEPLPEPPPPPSPLKVEAVSPFASGEPLTAKKSTGPFSVLEAMVTGSSTQPLIKITGGTSFAYDFYFQNCDGFPKFAFYPGGSKVTNEDGENLYRVHIQYNYGEGYTMTDVPDPVTCTLVVKAFPESQSITMTIGLDPALITQPPPSSPLTITPVNFAWANTLELTGATPFKCQSFEYCKTLDLSLPSKYEFPKVKITGGLENDIQVTVDCPEHYGAGPSVNGFGGSASELKMAQTLKASVQDQYWLTVKYATKPIAYQSDAGKCTITATSGNQTAEKEIKFWYDPMLIDN